MMRVFLNKNDNKGHYFNLFLFLFSFLTVILFITVLFKYFEPGWETNDDVGMSMRAHGYGLVQFSTPLLIFSNVLWGYIVQAIPRIHGILGYSTATYVSLIAVGTVFFYTFLRLGINYFITFLIFFLIFLRPLLMPQFTINSGFLLIGSALCWHFYSSGKSVFWLVGGCTFAFFSFLVRKNEFLLLCLVMLPCVPWKYFIQHRAPKIAACILLLLVGSAAYIDRVAYQTEEWETFNEFNNIRALFTDYKIGKSLKEHKDLLNKYHFSENDIDLISTWFFVDPTIANPEKLRAMVAELGTFGRFSLSNALLGILALNKPPVLPLVYAALLLLILYPRQQIVYSWFIFIFTIFAIGLLGRPGVTRVYIPIVTLLIILPFIYQKNIPKIKKNLTILILLLTSLLNAYYVYSHTQYYNYMKQLRGGLVGFPTSPVVVWGSVFPYEIIYPVLKDPSFLMNYKFYGLATSTLTPVSVAYHEESQGSGFIKLFLSEKGLPIIALERHVNLLESYCREHWKGTVRTVNSRTYGGISVNWLRCEQDQPENLK